MDAEDSDFDPYKTYRKPRKIPKVKRSPFEYGSSMSNSKKYWQQVFQEKDISSNGVLEESKKMLEVLPSDLYVKVCETLDIPLIKQTSEDAQVDKRSSPRRSTKEPWISFRTSLYIDRELDSDTDVEFCPRPTIFTTAQLTNIRLWPSDRSDQSASASTTNNIRGSVRIQPIWTKLGVQIQLNDHEEEFNVHKQLLRKPVREQITWATRYLLPEREDEKSLVKKADDLTDRIATEFCKYMKELGGDHQSHLFTPKAIKELFQIEFDTHVARGLRVITKELPSIEERVAIATGHPEKSRYEALKREVTKDIIAEKTIDITRGFGSGLARKDQYRAPRNDTRKLWRSARHVPKDLVTLKTVWEGITNIRSVKEYCRWMIDHPEHRKPPYLNSLGMFDQAVLDATQIQEANEPSSQLLFNEEPAPIDHIRRRLSELAD